MKKLENIKHKARESLGRDHLWRSRLSSQILILFFAILSIYSFNWTSSIQGINLFCRLSECVKSGNINGGDSYYYLYMGQRFQSFNEIESVYLWILNLWPPGMGIYYAILSRFTFGLFGIPVVHLVVLILLWYGLIGYLARVGQSRIRIWTVTLLGILFLNSAMFKNWIFSDGLLHSEGIAIYFLCLAIILFLKGNNKDEKVNLQTLFAGISLGLASYQRGGFDLTAIVVSTLVLIYRIYRINPWRKHNSKNKKHQNLKHNSKNKKHQKKSKKPLSKGFLKNNLTALEVLTLVYFCVTFPWRLILIVFKGSPTFVPNSNQIWINSWIPTNKLQENSGGYFVEAGMNGFCQAYQDRCDALANYINPTESLYRHAAFQELLNNPFPWIYSRLSIASEQLYRSYSIYPEGISSLKSGVNLIILTGQILAMLYLVFIFVKKMSNGEKNEVNFLLLPIVIFSVAPLLISSFEPRYFYPATSAIWTFILYRIAIPPRETRKPSLETKEEESQIV